MKDKRITYTVCLISVFLLKLFFNIGFMSVAPDILLVLIVLFCSGKDTAFGLFAGFLSGFMYYLSAGYGFWPLVFSGCIAGFLASRPSRTMSQQSGITALFSVFWISCVYNVIMYLFAPRSIREFALMTAIQVVENVLCAAVILALGYLFMGKGKTAYIS